MPDVLFTRHGSDFGFLIWPLGLFILPLGVLQLAGRDVGRFMLTGPRWQVVLLGCVWLAPYFALTYRSLH